jgi:hypothetical protein
MSDKNIAVFGMYSTRGAAELALHALKAAGFSASDVSILDSNSSDAPDSATGELVALGLPEYEAQRYEGRLGAGGVLLSVGCTTPDEIIRAREVVANSGAEHISTSGESMVETMKMPVRVSDR